MSPTCPLYVSDMSLIRVPGKTFKVAVMLTMTIHIISCLWWLWKVLSTCPPSEVDSSVGGCVHIDQFLDDQSWGVFERNSMDTMRGKIEAYAISMYVVTMTLTTVGYGDVTADNTSERVGYVLFFIVGAFVWGNLLAEITEIHSASSAREQEVMSKVQKTLEFLIEHEVPHKLRTNIIQWTRFHEDHQDDNVLKQEMIGVLPRNLQKGLVRHLYSREVSRVPMFAYIESVDDFNLEADVIQEQFLNEIFILFEYITYSPGQVLVKFSDPADRLIIVVSGKVVVEFEHSSISRDPVNLISGQFIGDLSLLGDKDWANSTCFNFLPQDTDELTEIMVHTPTEYVVTIQLTAEKFQKVYDAASVLTKGAIQDFLAKWKEKRRQILEEMDASKLGNNEVKILRITRLWEMITRGISKRYAHQAALGENSKDKEWNFAQSSGLLTGKTQNLNLSASAGSDTQTHSGDVVLAGGLSSNVEMKRMAKKMDKVLQAVTDMQTRILSLSCAHSLSHVQSIERIEHLTARVCSFSPLFSFFFVVCLLSFVSLLSSALSTSLPWVFFQKN